MQLDLENINLNKEKILNNKSNKTKLYVFINIVNLCLIISIYNSYSNIW